MTAAPYRPGDSEPEEDEGSIDLIALLGTLWRGKWIILSLSLLGAVLAGYYAFRVAEPTYRATTQMALSFDKQPVVDIESVMTGVSSDTSSLNTEMKLIRSHELASRLVDQLNLEEDPEFNPAMRQDTGFTIGDLKGWIMSLLPATVPSDAVGPTDMAIRNEVIDRVKGVITTSIERDSYVFSISALTSVNRRVKRDQVAA